MSFRGGLGQPGTRIGGVAEKGVLVYVQQALIGALAINAVVLCLVLLWFAVGWWWTGIFLPAMWLVVGYLVLWLFHPRGRAVGWAYTGGLMVLVVVGLWGGHAIWGWMFAPSVWSAFDALWDLFAFPWWAWTLLAVAAFAMFVKLGPRALWSLPVACSVYVAIAFDKWDMFLPLLERARYLSIPFLPAFAFFAAVLAMVLGKEMLWPNLEWTLKPVELTELVEVGMLGLWFPRLLGREWEPPEERRMLEIRTVSEDGKQRQMTLVEDDPALHRFYVALANGLPFTNRTGKTCGLTRAMYETVRDTFVRRDWARWKNKRNPKEGLYLTEPEHVGPNKHCGTHVVSRLAGMAPPSPTPDAVSVGEGDE